MDRAPYGTLADANWPVRKLWHTRHEELGLLPEPGEYGPLWTDNSRLELRIAGQQLFAQLPGLLNDRELYVLCARLEDVTMEELGRDLGVTRERIRQIEAKAVRKLKHWCRKDQRHGF